MNTNRSIGNEGEPHTLDDILDGYMSSSSQLDYETMMRWVERYPQYRDEIIDFTVRATMTSTTPPAADEADTADLDASVARNMDIVHRILQEGEASGVEAIGGLIEEGKARGLTLKGFADALGVSITLLNKLDRRLIKYSSIPGELISEVARVLARQVGPVAQYLQGPALHAVGANYRADEAPSLPEQQAFTEAVLNDRSLSAERKRELLAMGKSESV